MIKLRDVNNAKIFLNTVPKISIKDKINKTSSKFKTVLFKRHC